MKIFLKILLSCILSGWLLGDSIKDYKEGRYRSFGIDLMFFIVNFMVLIITLLRVFIK